MDDWGEDATRTPTAAWLAEQETKQAAYAARCRAWARRLGRGASPEEDEVEETAGLPPASGTDAAGQAGRMTPRVREVVACLGPRNEGAQVRGRGSIRASV